MRLFVALELPADVRAQLAAWADAAAPRPVHRVPADNLHLTLAFLGSRSAEEASAAGALLAALAQPLGVLRAAGALWLPPRRPRVLTVALDVGEALAAMQADLVTALQAAIGFEREARPFRPHVTVGRVARDARVDGRRALDPPAPVVSFHAVALTLYRSHTGPGGSRYEPLARARPV